MIWNQVHTGISSLVQAHLVFAFHQILLMRKFITLYHNFSAQLVPVYNILVNKMYFVSKKLLGFYHLYFAEQLYGILYISYQMINFMGSPWFIKRLSKM